MAKPNRQNVYVPGPKVYAPGKPNQSLEIWQVVVARGTVGTTKSDVMRALPHLKPGNIGFYLGKLKDADYLMEKGEAAKAAVAAQVVEPWFDVYQKGLDLIEKSLRLRVEQEKLVVADLEVAFTRYNNHRNMTLTTGTTEPEKLSHLDRTLRDLNALVLKGIIK